MAYVYLIGDCEKNDAYKIGVTTGTIENRLKKLQTGNAGELYLVNLHETDRPFYIERQLHMYFKPKRLINEWFALDSNDLKEFNKICEMFETNAEVLKNNPFFKE